MKKFARKKYRKMFLEAIFLHSKKLFAEFLPHLSQASVRVSIPLFFFFLILLGVESVAVFEF